MKQDNILEKTGTKYVMLCWEENKTHLHLFLQEDENDYLIFIAPSINCKIYSDNYFNILTLINKSKEQDNEYLLYEMFEYEIKEENEAREIIEDYIEKNYL